MCSIFLFLSCHYLALLLHACFFFDLLPENQLTNIPPSWIMMMEAITKGQLINTLIAGQDLFYSSIGLKIVVL
jgi:hypothetical protein